MTKRPRKTTSPNRSTTPASGGTPPPPIDADEPLRGEIVPLPAEAARRLAEIGADPRNPIIRKAVLIGSAYSGPIPPPEMLEAYKTVHPDLPEKIISWTESQRDHRMSLERDAAKASQVRMNRGQIYTFLITTLGVSLSAVVGIWGSPVVASAIAIVSVGGPTAAFVLARSFDWNGEKKAKNSPNTPDRLRI